MDANDGVMSKSRLKRLHIQQGGTTADQKFRSALVAIANMKITPDTNHSELCALMVATARTAIGRAGATQ